MSQPTDVAMGRAGEAQTFARPLIRPVAASLLVGEVTWIVALLALGLRFRLINLEHYSGSFDEGIRLEQLLLMELGFRPFRDIFASQGPLLLDLLFPLYLLFGGTFGAARLGVGVLSLVGLVGAWWALRPVGRLAGLTAATLLALSPGYLENSRLALAELPSLAPCLWAVGCALRWQRGGRDGWLYAAALLATLGLLIKPMAAPVYAPLALLALLRFPFRWRALALAAAASIILTALVLLALDPARVLEVLGGYRLGAQQPAGAEAGQNWVLMTRVLGSAERIGFLSLALAGLGLGLTRWPAATVGLLAWPLAQAALFVLYTDLADKHVVYLVPPLALLAGLAMAAAAQAWRELMGFRKRVMILPTLIGGIALAVYLATIPTLWRGDHELLRDDDERARRDYAGTREQAALMAALTGPDEFVLTDHPYAAFLARRPVPPWLVDTSGTRIDAGSLTAEVAIAEAERYRPTVVVTWRRRLGKLDGFNRWLGNDYRLARTYPGSDQANPLQLYVRTDLEEKARRFLATYRTSYTVQPPEW